MSDLINDKKVEEYLNELSDEYKTLLLNTLLAQTYPFENISISELLRLDEEIKKPLFTDYRLQLRRQKRLLTVGITYILMGLLMLIFSLIKRPDFWFNYVYRYITMSVIMGIFGFVVILISFVLPSIHIPFRTRSANYPSETSAFLEYEVVAKWRQLEVIVNDISFDSETKTPRSIIDYLKELTYISIEEFYTLKKFLKLRNSIVHSEDSIFSVTEMKDLVNKVAKIIDRIDKYA